MDKNSFSHNTQDSTSVEDGLVEIQTAGPALKKRHVCTICKQSFNAKGHLNRHMVIHSREQNHKCFICERSFSQRENLQRHFDHVHKGEKPFECDTCKKCFTSKAYLRKHLLAHSGENPICPICNKSIVSNLDRHLLTHKKPYVCNICMKSFGYKSNLWRHRLLHTGQKPNVCNICSAAFPDERHLKSHMKSHGEDEKCTQAPSDNNPQNHFSSKSPMKRNLVLPTPKRSFVCRVCDKSFTREQCLKRHLSFHFETKKTRSSDQKEGRSYLCGLCNKNFDEKTCIKLDNVHCKGKYKQHPYSCQSCLEDVLQCEKWKDLVVNDKEV